MGLRRFVITLVWTVTAAVLFFGFGLLFAGGLTRTLLAAGVIERGEVEVAVEASLTALGPLLLALSLVYRRLAGQENAGSLAAWLAGWGLLLYGGARLVGEISPTASLFFLAAALAVWSLLRANAWLRNRRSSAD